MYMYIYIYICNHRTILVFILLGLLLLLCFFLLLLLLCKCVLKMSNEYFWFIASFIINCHEVLISKQAGLQTELVVVLSTHVA